MKENREEEECKNDWFFKIDTRQNERRIRGTKEGIEREREQDKKKER